MWEETNGRTTVSILFGAMQGNKKGPIKRWDFENEDDYAAYQSNREALPKYVYITQCVNTSNNYIILHASCEINYKMVSMHVYRAAFQYGVKMHEGRKTRRSKGGGKGDMAKLNKQWQQISAVSCMSEITHY